MYYIFSLMRPKRVVTFFLNESQNDRAFFTLLLKNTHKDGVSSEKHKDIWRDSAVILRVFDILSCLFVLVCLRARCCVQGRSVFSQISGLRGLKVKSLTQTTRSVSDPPTYLATKQVNGVAGAV